MAPQLNLKNTKIKLEIKKKIFFLQSHPVFVQCVFFFQIYFLFIPYLITVFISFILLSV